MKRGMPRVDRFGLATLVIAAVFHIGLFVDLGDPSDPGWWPGVLPFFAWVMLPFVLAALSWPNERCPVVHWVRRGLLIALLAFSVGVYYSGFYVHPDAQGGLLFLFVPVYEFLSLAAVFALVTFFVAGGAIVRRHIDESGTGKHDI